MTILGASHRPRATTAWRRALRVALLAAAASLAGCGQPGPLYLPAAPAASVPPPPAPGSSSALPGASAPAPAAS
ncbi:lipoprotein [Thiomonas sp.]|uniref:LPS translocon maturation chaperone LptM n=1 Tax=Thiomonas sp. TaxID=2047785 RepID=UPI002626BF43|nr:lipoprotein [Thiomonas sp.]